MSINNNNELIKSEIWTRIFAALHLTLQEMLQLRLVCTSWKQLIEQEFCHKAQCLKLFNSTNAMADYWDDLIRFGLEEDKYLNSTNDMMLISCADNFDCRAMVNLFPNITNLVIHFDDVICRQKDNNNNSSSNHLRALDRHLSTLLSQWPHLNSISLFGSTIPVSDTFSSGIISAINSLISVRRLDLFLTSFNQLSLVRLSLCLSRLTQLSLFAYPGDIGLALTRLTGSNISRIRIDYIFPLKIYFILEELCTSLIANPGIAGKIAGLRLASVGDAKIVPFICGHFTQLQDLDLEFDARIKFKIDSKLIMNLNWLTNLTHLTLTNVYFDLNEHFVPKVTSNILFLNVRKVRLIGNGANNSKKMLNKILEQNFPFVHEFKVDVENG